MNPEIQLLQPYPFERLSTLLEDVQPAEIDPIALSIGEPRHEAPAAALNAMIESIRGMEIYPSTNGSVELREAMASWASTRFNLPKLSAADEIIALNGTREGLFAVAQCTLDRQSNKTLVLMPNPFYQIYEGATYLAGLQPEFYDAAATPDGKPDFTRIGDETWAATQMIYVCNPGNPTGGTLSVDEWQILLNLSDQHDFIIISDECYSEIYREQAGPPVGLLQAAAATGNDSYRNCMVFHSLSKRSNLPGLRSGFAAGDARLIKLFSSYRTYHGCSMPPPVQQASIVAWSDEEHVRENRACYDEKYDAVLDILSPVVEVARPNAGFYLWPQLPIDDETFTREMLAQHNVAVVPGSYLAREINGFNPGRGRSRLALVAELDDCVDAAKRIRTYLESV